ncbi:MAG: hypothetical protein HOY78_29730 [Saccharothrix sp.]|jgi:hypothetical protein|nr:hypothetical protein [Saccharothrix sp.]
MPEQLAPLEVVVDAHSDQYDPNEPGWRSQLVALRKSLQDADLDDVRREERPAPGHKAGFEAIVIALGTSGAITAAVEVFRAWLSRDRHRRVRLTFKDGDREVVVEVDANTSSDAAIESTMKAALEHLPRS